MPDEIQEALAKIFAKDSEIYQNRGFGRRIGYGKRPAIINIGTAATRRAVPPRRTSARRFARQ